MWCHPKFFGIKCLKNRGLEVSKENRDDGEGYGRAGPPVREGGQHRYWHAHSHLRKVATYNMERQNSGLRVLSGKVHQERSQKMRAEQMYAAVGLSSRDAHFNTDGNVHISPSPRETISAREETAARRFAHRLNPIYIYDRSTKIGLFGS